MPPETLEVAQKQKTHLYGLDHLRALAILMVYLFHYGRLFKSPSWVASISEFGWTGVDLFFVLSGYLIASQLFEEIKQDQGISLRNFFLKRTFRILPAYLLVVALYFVFPWVRERGTPAPLWKFLTFTQNIGLDLRTQGAFSHAWSLCIEEQFYIFLPLILTVLVYFNALKMGVALLGGFFLSGLVIRMMAWNAFSAVETDGWEKWYEWIYYPTYTRLDGLLVGVAIAAAMQFSPRIKASLKKYAPAFLLASLAVLSAAYWVCQEPMSWAASIFGFPLVDIGYGLLVIGAISPVSMLGRWSSILTKRIAGWSYALYLVHKIVIHLTQQYVSPLGIEADSNGMFIICLCSSLLAAYLINVAVEKPFLRVRNKFLEPALFSVHQY